MTSIFRLVLVAQSLSALARGEPTISFPYNAQLPPVARAGSLYSYSFSPHTFTSGSNLSYALGKHPDWLSFEAEERRLFGVPDDLTVPPGEDLVGQPFEIVATDDSGSMTMQSTIVVSRDLGPSVKMPISQQIGRFGDYSAPASIISYPATDFSYPFDSETFKHEPGMVNYYASSGDSSPLPAWIKFDAGRLTFSGQTPPAEALYQPPQRFDIRLVASDIEGFSSSSLEFSIVVGSHKISTDHPIVALNASRGIPLEYDGLADGIRIDARSVKLGELNATANFLPPWLSFDPNTWVVKGTPKEDDHSSNFTVRLTDAYSDALEILFKVVVATGLFQATFDDVEAIPGEDFSLDLSQHFRDPNDVEVRIQTEPEQDWLTLSNLEIKGRVPKSGKGATQIFIEATSKSSGAQEIEALQMTYLAPNGKSTMSPTGTSSTPKAPRKTSDEHDDDYGDDDDDNDDDDNDDNDDDASEKSIGGTNTGLILLATIIPIIAVALLIMILICCLRRRKNSRSRSTQKKLRTKISDPILSSLRVNGSFQAVDRPMTAFGSETFAFRNEKPPPTHAAIGSTHSHNSSRTSDTLGSFSSRDTIYGYRTHDSGNERRPVTAGAKTDTAQSWFTVERTPTVLRSERSTRSRDSVVTLPLSTHQLLPTPPFLSRTGNNAFRGGLELTIPSLEELPSVPLIPGAAGIDEDKSTGFYSTITSSSAALPSSRRNSLRAEAAAEATATRPGSSRSHKAIKKDTSGSDRDWSTMYGSELGEKVPELPLPSNVRMSSQQWMGPRKGDGSWLGNSPLSGLRSLMTETSFGSSENWRVIESQQRNEPSISTTYKTLVEDIPFSPVSSAQGGAGPSTQAVETDTSTKERKEDSSSDQPGNWVRPKASRSRFSRLNADEKLAGGPPNWVKEDSAKVSEGSRTAFV